MIKLNLKETAQALDAVLTEGDITFTGVSIDSRTVQAGNLFIAIKGEKFDGHQFISEVEASGAVALVVSEAVKSKLPQLIVKDTFIALGDLARHWRKKFTLPIIGITGSAGKTTTKQMLGAILSQTGNTLIPEGNKNNYYGVPLTLFQLNETHVHAVIEMGANHLGEIKYLASIVLPEVSIITNVAAVHIEVDGKEGFGSLDGVFKEKSEIFACLPENGVAIVNADDQYFDQWEKKLVHHNRLSFGLKNPADVTARDLCPNAAMQYNFNLITPVGNINLTLSSIGKHNVMNALAAAAAALAIGSSLENIELGLENVPLVEKRMIRYKGKQGALIIDDSYNANVKSVPAVMEVLAGFPGRRIMVFGDMLEIGATSSAEHYKIGEQAKALGLDYFYAYGKDSIEAVKAFGATGKYFNQQEKLIEELLLLLDEQTVVMVKGSRGMKMETVVNGLRITDKGE